MDRRDAYPTIRMDKLEAGDRGHDARDRCRGESLDRYEAPQPRSHRPVYPLIRLRPCRDVDSGSAVATDMVSSFILFSDPVGQYIRLTGCDPTATLAVEAQ